MQKKFLIALGLASACYTFGNGVAQAQPDANAAPKANNPANLNMGLFNQGHPLTAEQIKQLQTQQTESKMLRIRQRLTRAGFTDETVQTAIVDYVKAKDAAQTKLHDQYQKVSVALRDNNTPDTQLATLLNDFRASVEDEKGRQSKALVDLGVKINLAQKPRLDALLMTMGITGDEKTMSTQDTGLGGILNVLGGLDGLDDLDNAVVRIG